MSEILLLAVPYGKSYGHINIKDLGFGVPPLGLAYIGSFLKEAGFDVKLVDLMFTTKDWNDVRELIKDEAPRWVGISATTPQIKEAFIAAEIVKQVDPKIKVVIGGAHASALPEQTLTNKNIDILVYGEGEFTMLDLMKELRLEEIKGIFYKKDGKIIRNPPRNLVNDIDIFPFPLYEQLPLDRYGTEYFGTQLSIISTRGCPFQCNYCAANTIHRRKYRKRSVENVIGEIEKLRNKFNIMKFSFGDDTFTLDQERTIAICQVLIKKNLGMEWSCITRPDTFTKPLLKIMKEAGCNTIQIGIESGDNEILRLAKRNETVEEVIQAVSWVKEVGMEVIGYFIIGLLHETKETINKTIALSKKLKIDYAQFSFLVPLPGSEVWDIAQKRELLEIVNPEWENFGRYGEPIIRLKDVTKDELARFFTKAYREFYLRPTYVVNRLIFLKSLHDFTQLSRRSLALLKILLK